MSGGWCFKCWNCILKCLWQQPAHHYNCFQNPKKFSQISRKIPKIIFIQSMHSPNLITTMQYMARSVCSFVMICICICISTFLRWEKYKLKFVQIHFLKWVNFSRCDDHNHYTFNSDVAGCQVFQGSQACPVQWSDHSWCELQSVYVQCVFVYLYVCNCVFMYLCIFICVFVYLCIWVFGVFMYLYLCTCLCVIRICGKIWPTIEKSHIVF